ncbi:thioredoxin-disulfide reductase [Breznakiella homolactica]|uniref:Thioredoxin reductase n=1 Tax=Breznakiella homolactica TaxID=2798577 RepID=A0A7T7XNL0_9SPIR|nr:thioredoxin-disulfide reductase [Breznakiella homolactica]QQO09659.1 thioredoxin-disulfide reductase [Breznakiella homolactica]
MAKLDADLIIIGAGTAGLTAAQYGARANLNVLVLEQMAPGGQALLIDILENFPGNISNKSGFELVQDLHKQAEQFGAKFMVESALSLEKDGDVFKIGLGNGQTVTSHTVVLSTGAKHRTLDIPGEDKLSGRGVSYCATCDGPFFKGKKIFVVGGGDSACVESEYLANLTDKVVLIHRRDRFRAQKALAERVIHNPNIDVRFKTRMLEIKGDNKVSSVVLERLDSGEIYEEETDAVFVFIGSIPQTNLVPGIDMDEGGYIITDQSMASSMPGLFIAGDVRSSPFRQVVVAAAEGAIAAHSVSMYIDALKGESYL